MKRLTVQQRLGMAMKARREAAGLSQERLAFDCGLHRTYVGSVERGERNLSLENIIKIAEALNVTASELLREANL